MLRTNELSPKVTTLLGGIIQTCLIRMPISKVTHHQGSKTMPRQPSRTILSQDSRISDLKDICNIHNNTIKQISKMSLPAIVSLKLVK
jgi:hypothetical protein